MPKSFLELYREVGAKGDALFEALAKMGEDGVKLTESIIAGAHKCVTKKVSFNPSNIGGKKFHRIHGVFFLRNEKIAVLCTAGRGNKDEQFFFMEDDCTFTLPFDLIYPPLVKTNEIFVLYRDKMTREWVLFCYCKDTQIFEDARGKTKDELYKKLSNAPTDSRVHNSFGLIENWFMPDRNYGWIKVENDEYSGAGVRVFLHDGRVYLTRHK